ncbi:unnamed protein product [Prunus brigantina]
MKIQLEILVNHQLMHLQLLMGPILSSLQMLKCCHKNPKPMILLPLKKKGEEEGKLIATSYSLEACREAIIRFIILVNNPLELYRV